MSRAAAHYHTVTKRDLSPRQREVLALVAAGKTNGEIAEHLGISLDGAKWHVSEILAKLGVATREEASDWWRERQGVGHRISQAVRGFSPVLTWKVAVPVAAVAALGVAGLLFLGNRGEDGEAAAPARCTADDVILEPVEGTGPLIGPVSIAITARSRERPCTFEGAITGTLRTSGHTLDAAAMDSPRTTIGPSRTILAWMSWNAFCTGPYTRLEFLAGLVHKDEAESFIEGGLPFVVGRPECPGIQRAPAARPDFALGPAPAGSPIPAIGPDPLDAVYCYPSDAAELAKWMKPCEAVDRLQQGLNSSNLDELVRMLALKAFTCPEPGRPSELSRLCEGAAAGEQRLGIPVASLPSSGEILSAAQFRGAFGAMIETAKDGQLYRTRIATVACDDDPCTRFILGIANDGSPAAAYVLVEADGDALQIVAAGFPGEHALVMRRGGAMPGSAGTDGDQFVPIVGPY
jgi:DNA-binding CsgD family transcriptional regulator